MRSIVREGKTWAASIEGDRLLFADNSKLRPVSTALAGATPLGVAAATKEDLEDFCADRSECLLYPGFFCDSIARVWSDKSTLLSALNSDSRALRSNPRLCVEISAMSRETCIEVSHGFYQQNFASSIHQDVNNIWCIEGKVATDIHGRSVLLQTGTPPIEALRQHLSHSGANSLIPTTYVPGQFHPRIYRPCALLTSAPVEGGSRSHAIKSLDQLDLLSRELWEVLQTVEGHESNLSCYGHRIRNLLIIACTEVETQMKGVLVANEYSCGSKNVLNMKDDYIKLSIPLKLESYSSSMPSKPDLPTVSPFKGWHPGNGGKGPWWYRNYNAVKHDREHSFHKATLFSAIAAVAAVYVLHLAQFGFRFLNEIPQKRYVDFTVECPKWRLEEAYIPPSQGLPNAASWNAVNISL